MRRPIRPFTVERKRSGRAAPAAEAPLLDLPAPPPETTKAAEAPRWAAAEALFSTPSPADGANASPVFAEPARRILPSLIEPTVPLPKFDVEDAPRRGGRKPGSRNKSSRARETQGPKTVETVMRNVFEFWAREDESAEPAPVVAYAPAPALALRRRGRIAREELPRGERWKARLPRFAR